MIYEIINPSDAYTMASDDPAAACVACWFLGGGGYALHSPDGKTTCPLLILGGDADETLKAMYGVTVDDVMRDRRQAVIDALRSVEIGGRRERADLDDAVSRMGPADAAAYREARHDRMRTSMNNIGKRAADLAERMEQTGVPA